MEDKTVWMKGGKPCEFTDLDQDVQEGFWAKGYGLSFKPEAQTNTLPDDLPSRDELFAAGFETLDDVPQAIEALVEIKGIGAKGAAKIIEAIEVINATE